MLTRIASASPPPPAVVPDATPPAVAPISTSMTATPEPRRAERTDVSGALIQAGNPSQKTSLSQAALEVALDRSGTSPKIGLRDLPVEVLQHIFRGVAASDSAGDAVGGHQVE